ncbi:hypothetical protein GCM10022271_26240 [Corallibacter vietnamensis]|uniref:YD repeat-containing protein n=1 Tax=Corallibacter vietnamensis TaxID=904130 RepID=A0ABP7HEZ7_9FLAO
MKKTKLILTLILLNAILLSCSSDDSSNNPEPEPTTSKLVKTEKISETRKIDYTYNNNDLISSSNGTYNSFGHVSDFTYDSENRLTEWGYQETGSSSYSDTYTYTYNSNGLLSSYSANSENVTITYNGNIITLTGQIEGNANSQAEIELDNNGLIIKFTESNQYTNFGYDSNGNLVSAQSYDNTDNLLSEFTLQYDDKINPFYGQMESIYIERFIEFFWEFDGIYIGGFEGYSFPFLKNNITSINEVSGGTIIFTYTYNSEDYPTNVSANFSGDTVIYDIEYY